jgi:signal transduction histidine kinase
MLRQGSELAIVAARGFPGDAHPLEIRVSVEDEGQPGIFPEIYATQRPLILADAARRDDWQDVEGVPPARAWLGVPLIRNDEVIGMLSITRETADAFAEEDATLAATFAGQAAIALENAQLYQEIRRFNQELESLVQERTQALQDAYVELERLDRAKSDFIQVASHELRTPLTVLHGYSQILLRDPALARDERHEKLVSGIYSGAVRMSEIVNSMLDMVKVDNRALELYPEPLSIPWLLEPLCDKFAGAMQERRLTLRVENLGHLPPIEADPQALRKVFANLLDNACKFTPDGGTVTISGRRLPSGYLLDEGVEILVCDTGIGIDPEARELIFTKFYQTGEVALHSSGHVKFKGGGPGLGLAIARGIAEAHGGRLWAESPGYDEETCPGSCFHVVLPLRQDVRRGDES